MPHFTTKQCNRCHQVLPLTAEYWQRDRHKKDGYSTLCKQCRQEAKRIGHAANPESAIQRARKWREENREKHRAYSSQWKRDNPKKRLLQTKRYEEAHPKRAYARYKIKKAVEMGKLAKIKTQICADCGAPAQEYHHPDYDQPMYVIPLCQKCHYERHQNAEKRVR